MEPQMNFPQRRTAAPSGIGATAEVDTIRQELATMRGQSSLAPTPNEATQSPAAAAELEDEVSTLYRELQSAANKLEAEKAQRQQAEAELEAVRQQRLRETSDVVAELEKKRLELNALREERAAMKQWLDRGVSECRRVASDVTALKEELARSEKSCEALQTDKNRYAGSIEALSDELATVQLTLENVHRDRAVLEVRADENAAVVTRAEAEKHVAVTECDHLSAEIARLAQRVRGLEDAEVSMHSMCACVEQLVAETNVTERAIATGKLEQNEVRPSLTEAANNIHDPRPLSTMVIDAKRLLQQLQEGMGRLRAAVKRYVASKQQAHAEMHLARQAELDGLQRERDLMVIAHRTDLETLAQRNQDLESEIIMVADGVQRDVNVEAKERMVVLDRLAVNNKVLTEQCGALREDNEKLKVKSKRMKLDWDKVDESRRRFQQLQTEVALMQEYAQKLEMENRNLRLMMGGDAPADGATAAASPAASRRAATMHRRAFDDWRGTVMSQSPN
jgi:hypothetical protein